MPTSLSDQQVLETLAAADEVISTPVKLLDRPKPVIVPRPFSSPVDWRDQWIYFVMVDRFNNVEHKPYSTWNQSTDERQGGTFNGIRDQLSYIQNLGAGAIWLSPVLKNRQAPAKGSHHGYGIMDFLDVDPRFASKTGNAEEEFIELVNEAHARGMWVILDIVINHAGDIFAYDVNGQEMSSADWSPSPYHIHWRDQTGSVKIDWDKLPSPDKLSVDAAIWPKEFQMNELFRRQGKGGPIEGDFETLKEFNTRFEKSAGEKTVLELLIKTYQYVIARFDVDGFRIDTIKHVERDFAMTFCNAIREYAMSIGKENFFIFGENRSDSEELLAAYMGRYCSEPEGRMGADAALDFPLQWKLVPALKGFVPPTCVEDVYNLRKRIQEEKRLVNSHGEASRFFVTFLDNHDDRTRFLYPVDGKDYTRQLTMGVAALFCLQGIPCLYYGTEQGLTGTRELYDVHYNSSVSKPEHVREAMWGKSDAFNQNNVIYREISKIAGLRQQEPALRYGRQYFRPVSGNGIDFGVSKECGGILAFSRILYNREMVVVANTSTVSDFTGWVMVDRKLNPMGTKMEVAYSNCGTKGGDKVKSGEVRIYDRDNNCVSTGDANRVFIHLAPMEVQILSQRKIRKPVKPISGPQTVSIEGNIN